MGFIIIYITHKDMKSAKKVIDELLNVHLIACANFLPIQASYWWKGNIEDSKEVVSLVKTKKRNWEKVKSAVTKIHPYETPCIMKMDVEANNDYESWINKEVV